MFKKKKQIKNRLSDVLEKRKDFFIQRLEEEWNAVQHGARRDEIIRRSKEAGVMMAKTLLVLLVVGGALTVVAVAPNMFAAFGKLGRKRGFFDKLKFGEAKAYLRKRNLITAGKTQDGLQLAITPKGITEALTVSFKELKIKPQKRWDGIWRVVAFDIPNRHKWGRGYFSAKLKEMGFYPMQESVFVSPHPCKSEVLMLASLFSLEEYVRLMEVTTIVGDQDIRMHFSL